MQLIYPAFLWLSLLAIVPIALYLFRRKSKRVDVSTLVFFKTLAREHQESAWLRRLKKLLSLLMTLAMLFAVIFALARLILSPPSGQGYRSVVILLDRSASMAAIDSEGTTRLESAIVQIRKRLEVLPENTGVALIAYDSRPEVLQPLTLKRRELISRLGEVSVRPVAEQTGAAFDAASVLARLETPSVIWHVTDSVRETIVAGDREGEAPASISGESLAADAETGDEAVAAPLPLPEGVAMETIDVALETPVNAGITAFRMRPVPLEHGQFEAYVQVALNASAPAPVTGKLDVFVGGVLAYPREISLEPGQRQGLTLSLEGAEEQMLRLRLRVDGDCLAADNEVIEPLPRVRPVVAAWIAPKESADPFTELALSAIQREGELDLWKGSPENWPLPDGIDVVIFDGWLPDAWPENLPVIVMNPPGPLGPIRAKHLENGVPYDEVRVANEQHPILFRVSSGRVALTQTAVFDISGSLEPLWFAGTEPVLAAGEIGGQRIVMMGFSPSQSEHLPLMASFPLLVGNSLLWCAETAPSVIERLVEAPTGRVVPVAGRQVTWSTSRNGALEKFTLPLDAPLLELDRTGLWETDTGQRGAAYLLSRAETDIAAREARDPAGVDLQSPAAGASARLSGDVTWALLGILVTLLIAESWLFHRHAVY